MAPQFIWVVHETKKNRKVRALILRHVVDIDGTSFQQNCAEETRPRENSSATGDFDLDPLGSVECLPATRHFDGTSWRDRGLRGRSTKPEMLWSEYINLNSVPDKCVTKPKRRSLLEFEPFVSQNLRDQRSEIRDQRSDGQRMA